VARVVTHAAFGTATLRLRNAHVDIITARYETYSRPGALPRVCSGSIADDLARRDFTINAMALALTGANRGALLDPHDGRADLEACRLRALHERSFQDDATRILRAARYSARFGLEIESQTESWARRDSAFLQTISAPRLHREFARIFAEDAPELALRRLEHLGALQGIDPALRFDSNTELLFRSLRDSTLNFSQAASWVVLLWSAEPHDAERVARRLALTEVQRAAVEAIPAAKHAGDRVEAAMSVSEAVHLLSPLPEATMVALAAASPGPVRQQVIEFLTTLRHVRPALRGDDAIALGVPRGPRVAEVLGIVRMARLNGTARTREDEERIVRDYVSGIE
jgi:tRNA nucleotidyltransferase (CCA-adding enzyme)